MTTIRSWLLVAQWVLLFLSTATGTAALFSREPLPALACILVDFVIYYNVKILRCTYQKRRDDRGYRDKYY